MRDSVHEYSEDFFWSLWRFWNVCDKSVDNDNSKYWPCLSYHTSTLNGIILANLICEDDRVNILRAESTFLHCLPHFQEPLHTSQWYATQRLMTFSNMKFPLRSAMHDCFLMIFLQKPNGLLCMDQDVWYIINPEKANCYTLPISVYWDVIRYEVASMINFLVTIMSRRRLPFLPVNCHWILNRNRDFYCIIARIIQLRFTTLFELNGCD